jgi:DNA-binding XRE family transcriptional regulator
MDGQDWNPVIVNSGKRVVKGAGVKVPTLTAGAAAQRRVENEELPVRKTLSAESRTQMMQLRAAMKKTQVELNQMCGFPANTIREIEAGRLTPNPSQLIRLNNVLRVKFSLI